MELNRAKTFSNKLMRPTYQPILASSGGQPRDYDQRIAEQEFRMTLESVIAQQEGFQEKPEGFMGYKMDINVKQQLIKNCNALIREVQQVFVGDTNAAKFTQIFKLFNDLSFMYNEHLKGIRLDAEFNREFHSKVIHLTQLFERVSQRLLGWMNGERFAYNSYEPNNSFNTDYMRSVVSNILEVLRHMLEDKDTTQYLANTSNEQLEFMNQSQLEVLPKEVDGEAAADDGEEEAKEEADPEGELLIAQARERAAEIERERDAERARVAAERARVAEEEAAMERDDAAAREEERALLAARAYIPPAAPEAARIDTEHTGEPELTRTERARRGLVSLGRRLKEFATPSRDREAVAEPTVTHVEPRAAPATPRTPPIRAEPFSPAMSLDEFAVGSPLIGPELAAEGDSAELPRDEPAPAATPAKPAASAKPAPDTETKAESPRTASDFYFESTEYDVDPGSSDYLLQTAHAMNRIRIGQSLNKKDYNQLVFNMMSNYIRRYNNDTKETEKKVANLRQADFMFDKGKLYTDFNLRVLAPENLERSLIPLADASTMKSIFEEKFPTRRDPMDPKKADTYVSIYKKYYKKDIDEAKKKPSSKPKPDDELVKTPPGRKAPAAAPRATARAEPPAARVLPRGSDLTELNLPENFTIRERQAIAERDEYLRQAQAEQDRKDREERARRR
jgi:hypothetical protein